MDQEKQQVLRRLPAVEEVLQTDAAAGLAAEYSRERVVDAVRAAVDRSRQKILGGAAPEVWDDIVAVETVVASAAAHLAEEDEPRLRRVLNASGVVIHTNLGRSLLAPAAVERVLEVARHYNNLEYRLEEGVRGSRHEHVEGLLCRLTGAEAAMVVNNNAAAVLLMLSALAAEREVVVSRGQLVEIGGSFRIPDIMRQSHACLVEVGTTNKTRLSDYAAAIGPDTALLLRVHTSNFKVVGFSEEVSVAELVELGRREHVLVADDLGSGALLELPAAWDEPSVFSSVRAGADVVSFSGDKLLGGPQAGILVGREEVVERLKRHPLARAVRVDKMTLAALEGTLLLYQNPDRARAEVPTLRYLHRDTTETRHLAGRLLELLRRGPAGVDVGAERIRLEVAETVGRSGGGALPLVELPSHAVVVDPAGMDLVRLETYLRRAPIPVVGRITDDRLYLDTLTLEEEELELVADSFAWAYRRAVRSGDTRA